MQLPAPAPRDRLPFNVFMNGFSAAADRFTDVCHSRSRDQTFPPLFEALNWATAVDLRIKERWEVDPPYAGFWPQWYTNGDVVLGIRFVRNRVHHEWADAFDISLSGSAAAATGFVWRWLPAAQLPPGQGNAFRDEYEGHVAGDVVTRTLQRITGCFREAAADLGLP